MSEIMTLTAVSYFSNKLHISNKYGFNFYSIVFILPYATLSLESKYS